MRLRRLLNQCLNFEREARFHRGEIAYSLERMQRLAAALGSPQLSTPCVHVTGTNGKGSTCTYLAAIARAHGLRDGLYTSPHLFTPRERIAVCGKPVAEAPLVAAIERVLAVAGADRPSYFEALTLAAFLIFAELKLDFAVYEVGLGGRLDATNLVQPIAAAITTIGLDHLAVLGPTREAIAREKAGILKVGRPVFLGLIDAGPRAVIAEIAARQRAAINQIERLEIVASAGDHVRFQLREPRALAGTYEIPTLAEYQAVNAALALALFAGVAAALGVIPQVTCAAAALARTTIPGRFHVLPGRPTLVLDGGHTEQALLEVGQAFAGKFPGRPHCALVGALADKDRAGLARALRRIGAPCVVTRPDSPRALDPAVLLGELQAHGLNGTVEADPLRALEQAKALAGQRGVVLVTGSFYLVARILAHETKRKE
ncbi:MAG: folylpolyglutamate synthase/dihydrofolate synthase family protein [Planctomycetota bacterium]